MTVTPQPPAKSHGFSLIELMIGMGLFAVLSLLIATYLVAVKRTETTTVAGLQSAIDKTLLERQLFYDVQHGAVSLNALSVRDDREKNFFDYAPDVPAINFASDEGKRRITLRNEQGVFYLLVTDQQRGPATLFDPVAAYSVGPRPADFSSTGALSFVSLNKDDYISSRRPSVWKNGSLVFLNTPALIRPMSGSSVSMMTPPRSPVFLGEINGPAAKPIDLPGLVQNTHPAQPSVVIDSADVFLRTVPPIGGAAPVIWLRPVSLLKFDVAPLGDGKRTALRRAAWRNGAFTAPDIIAVGVKSVTFERTDITLPSIVFSVEIESGK